MLENGVSLSSLGVCANDLIPRIDDPSMERHIFPNNSRNGKGASAKGDYWTIQDSKYVNGL